MKSDFKIITKKLQRYLHKKLKLFAPLATVLLVFVTATALLLLAAPRSTFALYVDSGNCGLVVEAPGPPVDTSNLNPGDRKESSLDIKNTKDTPLEYHFNIEIPHRSPGEYPGLEGKYLEEVLEFTITLDDEQIFQGLLSEFRDKFGDAGILIQLGGNTSQEMEVSVYLPGEKTGNAYQGASVSVQFSFISVCTGEENGDTPGGDHPGGPDPGDEPDVSPPPEQPPTDESIIEEWPEDPALEPDFEPELEPDPEPKADDPPETEIVLDPEDPLVEPELPQTGELPPYIFYGLGGLLVWIGVILARRRRADRE